MHVLVLKLDNPNSNYRLSKIAIQVMYMCINFFLQIAVTVLTYLPILAISFYVNIWYLNQCIKDCVRLKQAHKRRGQEEESKPLVNTGVMKHQVDHVKTLFKK